MFNIMAEKVGFEPTHGLTRLADFESAPLGLLGTSPHVKIIVSQCLSTRKYFLKTTQPFVLLLTLSLLQRLWSVAPFSCFFQI